MKAVLIILALAGCGVGGWFIYQKVQQRKATAQKPVRTTSVAVEAAPVTRGLIREMRVWTGSLEPRARFVVAPKIAGRLEKLSVAIGDPVKRDHVVALLDDDELIQQAEQVRAEKTVADANVGEVMSALASAKREYDRVKLLHDQKIASDSDLDIALAPYEVQQSKLKVAEAQVAQKTAAVKAAQIRQDYAKVIASWEGGPDLGVVGEKFAQEGDTLSANAPIISVLDIQSVIAVIHVTDRDYTRLSQKQAATLTSEACPGHTFTGKIARMAPLFSETSRQARVEIHAENPQQLLKPGMFVRVTIELGRSEDATIVPLSAIASRGGAQGVFLVDEAQKKAKFVEVKVGLTEGERVQILSPPISGRVVTLGQHLLEDGTALIVSERKPPTRGATDAKKDTKKDAKPSGAADPTSPKSSTPPAPKEGGTL